VHRDGVACGRDSKERRKKEDLNSIEHGHSKREAVTARVVVRQPPGPARDGSHVLPRSLPVWA
jgi:hypothetical protein